MFIDANNGPDLKRVHKVVSTARRTGRRLKFSQSRTKRAFTVDFTVAGTSHVFGDRVNAGNGLIMISAASNCGQARVSVGSFYFPGRVRTLNVNRVVECGRVTVCLGSLGSPRGVFSNSYSLLPCPIDSTCDGCRSDYRRLCDSGRDKLIYGRRLSRLERRAIRGTSTCRMTLGGTFRRCGQRNNRAACGPYRRYCGS